MLQVRRVRPAPLAQRELKVIQGLPEQQVLLAQQELLVLQAPQGPQERRDRQAQLVM